MKFKVVICAFLAITGLFGRQAIIEIINDPKNGKIDLTTHWGEVVPATRDVYTYNEYNAYLEALSASQNSIVGDIIYEEAPEMKENSVIEPSSQSKVPKISEELRSNFKNKPVSDFKESLRQQPQAKPGISFN